MLLHNLIPTCLLLATPLTSALSIPNIPVENALALRDSRSKPESRHGSRNAQPKTYIDIDLEKRATGKGSTSSGSSSGSTSGTSSSGSGTRSGSTTNTGGRSGTGTGVRPTYGGVYYLGGARTPYASGLRSPLGILPILLIGGSLGFWAGYHPWGVYGAYNYPFPGNVTYYNETSGMNMTVPANCLCSRFAECGCEANVNGTYIQEVVGNGSYVNRDTVHLASVNGTQTLVMNGTLDNGTVAADDGTTASSSTTTTSTGAAGRKDIWGWGVVSVAVACGVLVL